MESDKQAEIRFIILTKTDIKSVNLVCERVIQNLLLKLSSITNKWIRERKIKRMDEYNCGDCARFYSVDEWNGECSKHGGVNCMSKICKDFILEDMRKEDERK